MREFFGIGSYTREPEGFMSWQHLLFVTSLMVIMTILAVLFGRRNRLAKDKNRVLVISAIMIDAFEIFKILIFCIEDPSAWREEEHHDPRRMPDREKQSDHL